MRVGADLRVCPCKRLSQPPAVIEPVEMPARFFCLSFWSQKNEHIKKKFVSLQKLQSLTMHIPLRIRRHINLFLFIASTVVMVVAVWIIFAMVRQINEDERNKVITWV